MLISSVSGGRPESGKNSEGKSLPKSSVYLYNSSSTYTVIVDFVVLLLTTVI